MISLDLPVRETPRPPAMRASYGGAVVNRMTSDWIATILSADKETRASLRTLRARSRQLIRDNAHAAGFVTAMEDNIIGPDGLGVNPRMRLPRGELLKKDNLAAWTTFQRWGEVGMCTADGQSSWIEFQRLTLRTWLGDGEAFVRRLSGFDNDFGFAVQLLDADLLDESYNIPAGRNQREITQGIEIDQWGKPVVFHFWNRHPTDLSSGSLQRLAIPASEIIHLFTQLRPNQRRGVPILTPALIALKMVDGYTEAEITQARLAAATGGFFTAKGENADIAAAHYNAENANTPLEMEAEPGVGRQLPPGWGWEEWNSSHPNGNFVGFQTAMLRVISRAVGVSAITFSGDLSDTSYSSGRVGLQAERERFRSVQKWFGDRLVVAVYRDVIRFAALSGQLALPRNESIRWDACQLEPRGWGWIDPKSDAFATEMRLKNKITSPQRVCAAEGVDIEDVLDEWQEFAEMLESRKLDAPTFGETPPAEPETEPVKPLPSKNGNGNGHGRLSGADLVTLRVS